MRKIYLLTLFLLLFPSWVKADARVILAKIDCFPDLDYFAVYPLEIYGHATADKFDSSFPNAVTEIKKYGMVDMHPLIKYYEPSTGHMESYSYTGECVLGKNKYEYSIRPDNSDKSNRCFDFLSFRMTLKVNGKVLTDDLLYSKCKDWRIQRISVVPEWDELDIWTDSNTVERFDYSAPDFKPINTVWYHNRPLPKQVSDEDSPSNDDDIPEPRTEDEDEE